MKREGSLLQHMPTIQRFNQVTPAWLTAVLGEEVVGVELTSSTSTWAQNASISALMASGHRRRLWLKLCLGDTFSCSEVNYYSRDYVELADAPLVTCYDSCYEPGIGYHLLLDDLSEEFRDRKDAPPTLEYGLALASAIGRIHAHHWESGVPPTMVQWNEYLNHIRSGIGPFEMATGFPVRAKFESHATRLRERWFNPIGLTLLHADINPTNVLTPKVAESPVFILDRQPFDWTITYGLAVYDLAYAVVPWWPYEFRVSIQEVILKRWLYEIGRPEYTWEQAREDWYLSVEHCLHIPIEWCRDPSDLERMRGLWEWQLANILGKQDHLRHS